MEQAMELRESIIELLGLTEEVSDDEILEKIKSLLELEQTNSEEKEREARYLTTSAIRAGSIAQEQEQHILSMFKKDFAGTKRLLNTLPKRNPFSIIDLINKKGAEQEQNTKAIGI
ncbi:hypothetical protein [Capnocytophaga catalasegens]|nr:hypothetical protein [Capnocytophaga catalasegens]